jgi:hypothetical protein
MVQKRKTIRISFVNPEGKHKWEDPLTNAAVLNCS